MNTILDHDVFKLETFVVADFDALQAHIRKETGIRIDFHKMLGRPHLRSRTPFFILTASMPEKCPIPEDIPDAFETLLVACELLRARSNRHQNDCNLTFKSWKIPMRAVGQYLVYKGILPPDTKILLTRNLG